MPEIVTPLGAASAPQRSTVTLPPDKSPLSTPTPAPAPAPAASPEPAPSPAPSDWSDGKLPKDDAAAKPQNEPAPSSPKPAAAPAPSKPTNQGPKELREELERTRKLADEKSSAVSTLEAKIKDYEARGLDTKVLTDRLEQREREFEALQGELRALKQEASPEFKEKWDKPFERAANYAKRLVTGLVKEDGQQASYDDFVTIYRMPMQAAAQKAREIFGDDAAPAVMEQVRNLQRMEYERSEAFEEEKASWKQKEVAQKAKEVQQREQQNALRERVRKELAESVDEYKDPVDDKELATARQEGYAIVDGRPQSYTEAMTKLEHMRHQTAAFGPMKITINRMKQQIADLTAQLEKTKPKIPGDGAAKRPGADNRQQTGEESYEDYLKKSVEG